MIGASLFPSLAEPEAGNALIAAVVWVESTLLGTVATTVAIICVSVIGFRMLSGRIPVRRGLTVIIGCFIVFGARTISQGIVTNAVDHEAPSPEESAPISSPPPALPRAAPRASDNDPYAGAAVPIRS